VVGDEGDEGVERSRRRRDATKKRTNRKVLGKCPQEVLEKATPCAHGSEYIPSRSVVLA